MAVEVIVSTVTEEEIAVTEVEIVGTDREIGETDREAVEATEEEIAIIKDATIVNHKPPASSFPAWPVHPYMLFNLITDFCYPSI